MKNVLIIGANSRIAQWADKMLLKEPDINLTMFVRNKSKLAAELQDKNVIVGDATNSDDLEQALIGQDIVYASLAGDVVTAAQKLVAYVVSLIKDPAKDVRDSVGVDKPGTDGDRPRAAVMGANGFDPEM